MGHGTSRLTQNRTLAGTIYTYVILKWLPGGGQGESLTPAAFCFPWAVHISRFELVTGRGPSFHN